MSVVLTIVNYSVFLYLECAERASLKCSFIYAFIYSFILAVCGILVPQPGIEPRPTAVKALSLNCWNAREFPHLSVLNTQK